ncbi:MAG: VCBS repeat-containing protein [Deltaproteobacteria bacterium]|nr:VCBS repeat-containing protein [Deltaproteobacteria bacterium]
MLARSRIGIGSGDLNGDKSPDLIVSNAGYLLGVPGDLSILLNTGAGFAAEYRVVTDAQPTGLVVGDLNVDGDVDVAVVHANGFGSNNVVVFLGDGLGGLARAKRIPIPEQRARTGDWRLQW